MPHYVSQHNDSKKICHYGHTTTSSRDRRGNILWNRAPNTGKWHGIKPGATLCQKCYEIHYRAAKDNLMPKIQHVRNVGDKDIPVNDKRDAADSETAAALGNTIHDKCITESVQDCAKVHGPSVDLQSSLGKPSAMVPGSTAPCPENNDAQ